MTPPRLARALLRLLVPRPDRGVILGDIDEEFAVRRRSHPAAARAWYWVQVAGSLPLALRAMTATIAEVPGDVRYTARTWRRSPAFAAAAIVTQAIGIAVATAIIAVAYTVLVRPLPYRDADRLVQIFEGAGRPGLLSYQDFVELRRASRSFEDVAGFSGGSRTLSLPGLAPERVATAEVSDGFFDLLGVRFAAGRGFAATETARSGPPVVVLSHGAWTRRLGADAGVVGRSLVLNGTAHTILGILPRDFEFPLRGQAELWLPMRPSPQQEERGYWHWMDVLGRVRAGVLPAQIEADLQSIASSYAARDSKFHSASLLRTQPLRDVIVGDVRPTIYALLAGVALVLVATCATMAGLLLSRASGRAQELGVRAAVGANRGRLVRQLVTENILLAVVGGAAGLVFGRWLLAAFVTMIPAGQRAALPHFQEVGLHPAALAAIAALTLVTGLVFGVLPALRASRGGAGALSGTRVTAGRREGRVRFVLVTLQVSVAFVLLAGAALLGTSVYRLLQVHPGFDNRGLVTMRLTLSSPKYAEEAAVDSFNDRLLERLHALPGVEGATLVSQTPLTGRGETGTPRVIGRPPAPASTSPDIGLRTVSANYFDTMGIPLVRGRAFAETDRGAAPGVVLINQLLAEQVFGSDDPVGERITFEFSPGPWHIVGIVGNEQLDDIDKALMPVVYFPASQDLLRGYTIVVRTAQPAALPNAARAAVAELDPDLPLFGIRTVEQITTSSGAVFMRRAAMALLGVFAVAALLLAAVALYGVLAQAVGERTREIGVRMAIGASRRDIVALVLRGGLAAIISGIVLGLGGTLAVSRLLRSLLFGVSGSDPLVLAGCALVLTSIALLACAGPLWRAVGISPATAMRTE